jgi:hypothetical protein
MMLTNQGMYLREQDRNTIIMALTYLKNDYTPEDLESLGFGNTIDEGWDKFETVVQELISELTYKS